MNRGREIEEERRRQSEEALRRVARDTESIGDGATRSTLGRVTGHFAAGDAVPEDRVDVWGKRIGRILALVAVIALLVHLLRTYVLV